MQSLVPKNWFQNDIEGQVRNVSSPVFEMVFDVFEVFATSANETGNGYGTVGMNSHVVNSSWTVAILLVERDAWFASCRCLLQEGTARQEEAQHSMLHVDCM